MVPHWFISYSQMSWKAEFSKILTKIIARRDSEVFREPVNHAALGIPDYPLIVTQPMDLGTVSIE